MGDLFGKILSFVLGLLFKKSPAPSRVEVQTERAAVAEAQRDEQVAVAQQQAAVAKAIQAAPKDEAETAAALRKGGF